jgi:fimbrial isopeptide formation D2 family protein
MKIGKKSYVVWTLVLLAGIFSVVLLRNTTPMKASEEKYSIITGIADKDGKVPVTIKIAEPLNETLVLSYEGVTGVTAADMLAGLSPDLANTVKIEDTDLDTEKRIITQKSSQTLELNFFVEKSDNDAEPKMILSDEKKVELASAKLVFPETVSTPVMRSTLAQPTSYLTGNYPGDNGQPGPTTQEMEAANQAANAAIGFNPEVNVKYVSTWADLRAAYNDTTVTKIVLEADISNSSNQSMTTRRTSIEIDGAGHTLYLGSQSFEINSPTDGIGFFHIHDMVAQQNLNNGLSSAGRYAFVNGTNFTSNVAGWTFRTGNITTEPTNGKRVGRFIRAYQSMIQTYGYMNLTTTEENYYAGGMIIEDKTQWRGTVTYANYSAVWFVENSTNSASTSKSMEFTVGKDALVSLKNETTGATYPAVYQHYRGMTIGEGSTYNSNMQGNSVRFDDSGSSLTVKKDATVNLLSRGTGSVMQFSADNTAFNLEPKGSIYIVGSTTSPIVDITGGSNRTFTMNSPKGFDIRNKNTGSTSNSPAVSTTNVATNILTINDSDIDLWTLRSELMGPSQQTYAKVEQFSAKANGGTANVTTTEPGLASFVATQYRRIAGMNANPEVEWVPVTDADKTYKARVKIGMTPTDNFDEDGNVILQPVYAAAGQAEVTFTDTFGDTHTVPTDASGYATVTDTRFNIAGKDIKAHAVRGPWISETDPVTTVIDVTPPEPALVTGDKVTNGMKQLSGKDAEPKAKIYLDINSVRQAAVGVVNDDGTWTYNLPHYLEKGDVIQIFLEDNAAKITETLTPAAPSTNTDTGNINPATDTTYRDATFKAATKYTAEDVIPDKPLMDKKVVSTGGSTTQVGDTLTYTLTATNGKEAGSGAVWNNVSITDSIPAGLTFDPLTADVTINGTAAVKDTDYTYDVDSRLLTIKAGNLRAGESAIVTFKTEVEQSAVGKIVNNIGTATGFSPRESGAFIEGADDPERAHDIFTKDANVDNPGGSIFGILELVSAPKTINFGETEFSTSGTKINNPSYEGDDLVVKDGRAVQETWTLNARLEKELAKVDDPSVYIPRAIRYVHQNKEITLMGASQAIASRKNENNDPYNISGTWSPEGDGFKLKVESGQSVEAGEYEATIVWELVAGPPPVNP